MKNTLRLGLILSRYAAVIRDIFEQKWFSAANKFCVQTNDFAGYVLMDVYGEALELGLCAVAKTIQREFAISNHSNSEY